MPCVPSLKISRCKRKTIESPKGKRGNVHFYLIEKTKLKKQQMFIRLSVLYLGRVFLTADFSEFS